MGRGWHGLDSFQREDDREKGREGEGGAWGGREREREKFIDN
jgi:hypothetical protein